MQRTEGCFKIWTDENSDRRIIYSIGNGVARAHEVEWLYKNLCEMTSNWHDSSWAYVAFIEKLEQVSPKGSTRYIKLHETLSENNCKYIAYVEGNSYEVSVQAARHKEASNTPGTTNKYFTTVDEALEWLKEKGF
ncbi:MAG: hypothetical protein PHS74_04725 [Lachnospiraceae bacterium]|nr:hypothetical protein [Lachnospiraceae bacterium]